MREGARSVGPRLGARLHLGPGDVAPTTRSFGRFLFSPWNYRSVALLAAHMLNFGCCALAFFTVSMRMAWGGGSTSVRADAQSAGRHGTPGAPVGRAGPGALSRENRNVCFPHWSASPAMEHGAHLKAPAMGHGVRASACDAHDVVRARARMMIRPTLLTL